MVEPGFACLTCLQQNLGGKRNNLIGSPYLGHLCTPQPELLVLINNISALASTHASKRQESIAADRGFIRSGGHYKIEQGCKSSGF
jgi:hypothetical protein